jgi:FtsP/CotA-like multicopper oxidase with cupredoxin domain
MLGHDEPIRVRQGERLLFRLLNASATMEVALALPGHRFTVLALDGNPVPTPASVEVLKLDVAERADVIVEMSADAPAPLRGANKVLGGSPAWRDTHELRPRVRSL